MGRETALEGMNQVRGDSAASQTSQQALPNWLDVGNWLHGIFTLFVDYASVTGGDTLTIGLYTCTDKDAAAGSAKLLATFTTVTSGTITKRKVILGQDAWPMERWVFWQLASSGTAGAFDAQFRISAMLKGPG